MKDLVTVRIESSAFDLDAVRIVEITGTESISRLFEMTLRMVALDPAALDEDKLLTSAVELVFERTDDATHVVTEERRIGGMISALRDRFLTETEHREVIATFVPRAWLTTLTRTTDIFMDMSVPDIVKKKLETGAGLAGADVEMRLEQTYPAREFVVQYKESDHDFICRLTEDLGIHFFFEKKGDKDVLVFADDNAAFKPTLPEHAPFVKRGEAIGVSVLEATRSVVPKVFKARDYNYRNPSMDLLGEVDAPTVGASGMVDEFGPHAKTADEAKYYAALRAQEANTKHFVFEGQSDLPGLRAGSMVVIEGHPRGELKLVITEVRHAARQAVYGAAEGNVGYSNTFKAIPERITYRPARITPKPVVHGVVTGIVQAEASTNFGAVDAEGRYRVSFMYDTVTDRGEGKASRPLRMAQPSAGADRGFHQPLKVGTEVIITCLNGDPDRPIISGAVPNPQTPSPVTSANAEKSMWKTNVSKMAFDDDQPRMKMEVDGDKHVFQIGQPNGPEHGFWLSTAANVTSTAAGISTQIASTYNTYQEYKTALTGANIVNVAGVPNPWKLWEGIEAVASQIIGWTKAISAVPAMVQKAAIEDAADSKKEAEEKHKETKEEIAKTHGLSTAKGIKQIDDGSRRSETKDEALDRALKEKIASDEALAKELQAKRDAVDKAQGADKVKARAELEKLQAEKAKALGLDTTTMPPPEPGMLPESQEMATARALKDHIAQNEAFRNEVQASANKVAEAAKTEKELTDFWEESGFNAETGAFPEVVKKIETVIAASSSIRKLASIMSDLHAKVTDKASYTTVAGAQLGSRANTGPSGERHKARPGKFAPFCNIQFSSGSSALYGALNAFVGAGATVDVSARKRASVSGGEQLHLKSRKLVEVSAREVFISAKDLVDVESTNGQIKIVAKETIHIESKTKDINMKAEQGYMIEAKKAMFQVQAERSVAFFTKNGNVTCVAQNENINLDAKRNVLIDAKTEDFRVKTGHDAYLEAKEAMGFVCKAGNWTAKDDLTLHGGKLTLTGKGKATLDGSKIHIG